MISALIRLGYSVTLFPMNDQPESTQEIYQDIPRSVKVVRYYRRDQLGRFLQERQGYYDLILVSRPHNMAALREVLSMFQAPKILYDAEALFSFRDIEKARLEGQPLSPEAEEALIADEIKLAENSCAIISVSENEASQFRKYSNSKVYTLGHALPVVPTPNPFAQRQDILFVGPLRDVGSPNIDSVTWFINEVFPLISESLGPAVRFLVAGTADPAVIAPLEREGVKFLGCVDDLTDLYAQARLFVAPTRYAAGIPLKIYEAAAHGLPVVGTPLVSRQLTWRNDCELLVADGAQDFAAACIALYQDGRLWETLRLNALERVRVDCSMTDFVARLKYIVEENLN